MNGTFITLALLTTLALVPSPGSLRAADTGVIHIGKGTVLSVDIQGGRLLMAQDPYGHHVLSLTHQTRVVDEVGSPILPAALQPGDLIREECLRVEKGKGQATLIRRVRPAWMELASPEL